MGHRVPSVALCCTPKSAYKSLKGALTLVGLPPPSGTRFFALWHLHTVFKCQCACYSE